MLSGYVLSSPNYDLSSVESNQQAYYMQLKLKYWPLLIQNSQTNLTKDFSNGKNGKLFPPHTLALLAVVSGKTPNEPWPAMWGLSSLQLLGGVSFACDSRQEVPC